MQYPVLAGNCRRSQSNSRSERLCRRWARRRWGTGSSVANAEVGTSAIRGRTTTVALSLQARAWAQAVFPSEVAPRLCFLCPWVRG